MIELTHCPICGNENIDRDCTSVATAPYFPADLHGAQMQFATLTPFSECLSCGTIFQAHQQDPEWYQWFYSSGSYRNTLGLTQEVMDKDELLRAIDLTAYLNRYNVKPIYHYDIGASRGIFLQETKVIFGCEISGDDPYGSYNEAEFIPLVGKPDLVSAIHVLEHTTDPLTELKHYADLTSKYLLVEVPGLTCMGGPLRFAHLFYFPPQVLADQVTKLEFEIINMQTEPNTRILARK
jgi:hypothetical protein